MILHMAQGELNALVDEFISADVSIRCLLVDGLQQRG